MERYPLQWPTGWPRTNSPVRSKFGYKGQGVTIDVATKFVQHEIELLTEDDQGMVSKFIISTNLKYRNDGLPYSQQREPDDQGAAVYFHMDSAPGEKAIQMVIACDTFDKIASNIYAIGKTIEAMRGISRWGCSELMRRAFTGFKALPEQAGPSSMPWWEILGVDKDAFPDVIQKAYRTLAKQYHPDINPGVEARWHIIQRAYKESEKKFQNL